MKAEKNFRIFTGDSVLLLFLSVLLTLPFFSSNLCAQEGVFTGRYYNDMELSEYAFTRQDDRIDFAWGEGSPHESIENDTFSIEWTGEISVASDGVVPFFIESDDGVRLFVDEELIIDDWNRHAPAWNMGEKYLTAGPHTVKLQYFEYTCGAMVRLCWYHKRTLVPDTPPAYDAGFHATPKKLQFMAPGQELRDSLVIQNYGLEPWEPAEVRLKVFNKTLGQELQPTLLQEHVAPEGYVRLDLVISAPMEEGAYWFEWQMYKEGVGLFGQKRAAHLPVFDATGCRPLASLTADFDGTTDVTIEPGIQYTCTGGPVDYTDGTSGEAAVVNGGQTIEYRFSELLAIPEGTIQFWAKAPDYNQDNYTFISLGSDVSQYFFLSIDIGRYLRFSLRRNVSEHTAGQWATIRPNEWFHLAAVWKNHYMLLYMNGFPITRIEDVDLDTFLLDHIKVGWGGNEKPMHLDSLRITPRALDGREVKGASVRALQYDVATGIQMGPLPQIARGKTYPVHVNAYCTGTESYQDVAPIVDWQIAGNTNSVVIEYGSITGVRPGTCSIASRLNIGGTVIQSPPTEVIVSNREKALILLDEALYPLIETELLQYKHDVEENTSVELMISPITALNGMNHEEVRQILRQHYLDHGIIGVVLIGHVPYAIFGDEWMDIGGTLYALYYEDLDALFEDTDENGSYDRISASMGDGIFEGAEIWSGWIYPNTDKGAGIADQAEVIRAFLQKTHRYYTREFQIANKAVMYYDGDGGEWYWSNLDIQGLSPEDDSFYLLSEVDHYGKDVDEHGRTIKTVPMARAFLEPPFPRHVDCGKYTQIWNTETFEICNMMTHANPGGQWFGGDEHFLVADETKQFARGAVILTLRGCAFNVINVDPRHSGLLAYPFGNSHNQAALTGGPYATNFNRTFAELSKGDYLGSANLKCKQSVLQDGGNVETLVGNPFVRVAPERRLPRPWQTHLFLLLLSDDEPEPEPGPPPGPE
ncbi:MAG: PA14 domain-containing protein [Thermodesulfobacteriota bacterium]|nr:PA14 domain-containing protein [Thermodesulfobacteriota bacterium]